MNSKNNKCKQTTIIYAICVSMITSISIALIQFGQQNSYSSIIIGGSIILICSFILFTVLFWTIINE